MGKKKFIDKKNAAKYKMFSRDTSDPRYSDAPDDDRIFFRVDRNSVEINGFIEEEEDHSRFEDAPEELAYGLPAHVRKENLELGFPDDGYNYLQHLRVIKNTGGGSNFYVKPKLKLDQLPRDIKAYDASRVKISGMMNEEGDDDKLMYSVASKTVDVKLKRAIDPEVVELLENSDVSDIEDLEEDFVIQANLTKQGEASGVNDDEIAYSERHEVNDGETAVGLTDKPVVENPRVPRQIDELFDQLQLNEYGSDSDSDGYIAEDGEEEEEGIFMTKDIQNLVHEQVKDYELKEKYMNPADILKNSDSVTNNEEVDTAAHIIRRTVEYAENFDKGNEDEYVEVTEESSDESEKWDCETIITTYSTLDNLPGKISSAPARQKKLSQTVAKALSSNGNFISLQGKEKIPVDFLPGKKDEQTGFKSVITKAEPIKRKAHGQESKEEKKERKEAVKTERREARMMKKETKELYRCETKRAQKTVAVSGPSAIHL